jgi:ATP-binding cassette subfamily B protein
MNPEEGKEGSRLPPSSFPLPGVIWLDSSFLLQPSSFSSGVVVAQQEPRPGDNAFSKACGYLNFDARAKWTAHAAAVASGLVGVALLAVLWLFTDFVAWRGRVPDHKALTPEQRRLLEDRWKAMSTEDRTDTLRWAGLEPAEVKQFAADGGPPLSDLRPGRFEAVWDEFVWDWLRDDVGLDAAREVLLPSERARSGYELDQGDHGILSLVVRHRANGRRWSPIPWLARTNRWMWDSSGSTVPTYLTGLTLIALLLGLLWVVLVVLNRESAARASIEATTRLRRAVYHHTFRLGTLAVRALGPSEAVSLLTRHIEALHDALYARLTVYFREPTLVALLLVFAFFLDPGLALCFLLFAVVVWLLGVRIVASFRAMSSRATAVAAERLTIIRESLMLMRLVKCYLMEQFNQARIERQLARYAQVQLIRYRGESLAEPALLLLGGLCGLVLLFVGALLVLRGFLSVAGAVALTATLLCLYRPATRWLEGLRLLTRGKQAAVQIFGFLDRRGEVGQVVGAEFLPPLSKQIEFDNVSLRDPTTNRLLLEEVSFAIPAGQRVALVGPDDLEKHALVYLIPRLLDPTAGEIRIDQHNLRWVTLDSLRAQIGVVMVHNLVFHDTVRNNIGCGDPLYSLPQIIEAAKLAHAHHFIQKLPQGYETPIGELGHSLSLTEQYRVALARAILRDPALLIIEELQADLDDDTKDLLDDTLARVLPGRTAVFLPHRISTLRSCNTVFLVNKGKIVVSGTHKELLAGHRLYRHLHYLEFSQVEEQ